MNEGLLTLDDLAVRWRAPGKTAAALRKWVWRRVYEWGVPFGGSVRDPRFLPAAVALCERRNLGGHLLA